MNPHARTHPAAALAVLLLHVAFLAAVLAQRQQARVQPEPRWITFSLPASKPLPVHAMQPLKPRAAASARAVAPVQASPPLVPGVTGLVELPAVETVAPDFSAAPRIGKRQIREAIAATIKEEDARRARFIRAAPPPSTSERFAAGAQAAEVPGCLRPDALKHNPPHIGPIALGGLLALPWLVGAAATGKCK